MTVSSQDTVFQHVGNGVTTTFAYSCQVPTATDLRVYLNDIEQASGFTLTGIGSLNGGTVVFTAAPANGVAIRIERDIELERTTDYQQNGDFLAVVVNPDFDRLWMALQQQSSANKRAIKVPKTDTVAPQDLPAAAQRANKLLSFAADGQPIAVAPADQSASALAILLATTAGGNNVGFDFALNYVSNTIGWGVQVCGNSFNLLRLVPPSEWPAIANFTSAYDVTAILNTAISNYKDVFVPPGKWNLNPDVGVLLVNSMRLRGAAQNQTVFAALAQGGTTAELATYTKGSIFKRAFTPGVANPRVDTVHMSDFAVVMNHPAGAITATEIQIGIDLRHVSRFNLERLWVGNIAPVGGPFVKADPGSFGVQGYGIVVGNIDSGNIAYCGGEVGTIRNCSVYGCFKNIVIDDLTLSPLSGAHAITIQDCDIQAGHSLLAQEQQYTTNNLWDGNVLQNVVRQPGNASATYVYRIAGYENELRAGYIEAGVTDYILRFDSASLNNRVTMRHYSATTIGIAAFSDAGRRNRVEFCLDTNTLPGGVDSKGLPWVRYDRSYLEMSIVAHWNGSAVVVDAGFGLTMTRPTAAGDYVFTFATAVLDANGYTLEVSYDTNASGHGGTHAVISHNASNVRIQFYAQNGATSTAIDPRFVFVRVKQIGG